MMRAKGKIWRGFSQLFLTDFTELKGCGCKVPKKDLLDYLRALPETQHQVFSLSPDCYIREVAPGLTLASTLDFFYPLVDDPFLQGQIAAANVLSDLFAMGVTRIDHFLVILGLSRQLSAEQRTEAAVGLMRGIDAKVREAGGRLGGGQTVLSPWVTVGGSALGFFEPGQRVRGNDTAQPGDLLVLTKPLGTQLAVNIAQYFRREPAKAEQLLATGRVTRESFASSYAQATAAMARLNLPAAQLMTRLGDQVRASTDVTGFGLRGHAENLLAMQRQPVDFCFKRLPVFAGLKELDGVVRDFKLREGLAAETSGGLLLVLAEQAAERFTREMRDEFGQQSWVVGEVRAGSRAAVINEKTEFFDV